MSQASKRRKLSLKKRTNASNPPEQSRNTIISMFKQQTDRQTNTETGPIIESGSEGDVVITNVTGLSTDVCLPVSKSASPSRTFDGSKLNQRKYSAKNLSLSERKRRKVKDTNDSESASDSDFDLKRNHRKNKNKHNKLSRSLSALDASKGGSPYRLRKRNTVPVVEVSDSDTDNDQNTDKHVKKTTDNVTAGIDIEDVDINLKRYAKATTIDNAKSDDNAKGEKDIDFKKKRIVDESTMEDVIVLPNTGNKSRYFGKAEKRKLSNSAEKVKLSLKRSKSDKTLPKESGHFKGKELVNLTVDDNEIKEDTNDGAKYTDAEKVDSKEKQTHRKSKLSDKVTSKAESSPQAVETELEHSEKPPKANVNYVLMQKPSGSKEMNVIPSESKTKTKDRKSSVSKQADTSKKNLVNNKSSSKNSSKPRSGLKDKNADVTKTDTNEREKTDQDIVGDDYDNDDDNNDAVAENSEKTEYRVPYYLENFKTIMESVLEDEENARLFDDIDMKYFTTFNELEEPSQKLYVRLFSRKLMWLSMSKINYPEISDNIPELVDILIAAGLLHSGTELSDLSIVLKILSAPDLKALAKSFHINSQGMTKGRIIDELLKKGQKSSISSMFKGGTTGTMEKTILNRAKTYIGKVCRLDNKPRAVFIRILMLFSLYNTNFDEESGGGGQNQLFQMLMVNIGRVVYPSYTVNRDRSVFQDPAALVRFETALQFEMDIQSMTERGKWSQAYELYKQAKESGKEVCKNKYFIKWDSDLPRFLRLYTAGSVYTRIDNLGVEILQRLKLYKEAVALLEELLAQDLYCVQYRGHWYERLALNLEAHLKSVEKSIAVIKRGLLDPTVRTGRRLALYERARKICEAPKSKYADSINEFEHQNVLPTPEVQIEGMVMSDATSVDMKYKFVMQGDSDSVTFCAVEELVLEHYKQNGYPDGLHAEGSIVSNLFILLFWDIMFMDVPNVFHGPFQSCPLDIATQDFYINRQQHLNDRLEWLKNASIEELDTEVGRVWSEQEGKMCTGINWDKFSGPDTHQNLISCMGGPVIAGILERYVKDPRHTRSGFPDLTLWNTDTKQFKICEVKGPNDKLSYKQILWIDYLLKLGVDAEVCYVKAVGSKKLKPVVRN